MNKGIPPWLGTQQSLNNYLMCDLEYLSYDLCFMPINHLIVVSEKLKNFLKT